MSQSERTTKRDEGPARNVATWIDRVAVGECGHTRKLERHTFRCRDCQNGVPQIPVDEVLATLTSGATLSPAPASKPHAPRVDLGLCHAMLPKLIKVVDRGVIPYLTGPSGSGKSFACRQLAIARGVPFYIETLCPMDMPSKIYGFIDGYGKLHRTSFREAWEHGGVILYDELDNSSPLLQVSLNDAIANGHCAFPDGIVKRHPDFRMVAAGNTAGRGANPLYLARQPFDGAFASRFVYLFWGYDAALERAAALRINPDAGKWVDYVQAVRAYVAAQSIPLLVTPRATLDGATLLGCLNQAEMRESLIFKGCDPAWAERIVRGVQG